jgi:hypothetical protein
VKYYLQRKSFTEEDEFVCILSDGTPESKNMEKKFDQLRFAKLHDLLVDEDVSDRGNKQIADGFAHQNQKGRDDISHIYKPQIKKGTKDKSVLQAMVILGNLGKLNGLLPSIVTEDNIRNQGFSKQLHPKNDFEGFTFAVTDLDNVLLVKCHVDQYNCHEDGYNSLVIASWLMVVNGAYKRVATIGYHRKAIHDYYKRYTSVGPVMKQLEQFMSKISNHQKQHLLETMESYYWRFEKIIDGCVLTCGANVDKRIYISSFVHAFLSREGRL